MVAWSCKEWVYGTMGNAPARKAGLERDLLRGRRVRLGSLPAVALEAAWRLSRLSLHVQCQEEEGQQDLRSC